MSGFAPGVRRIASRLVRSDRGEGLFGKGAAVVLVASTAAVLVPAMRTNAGEIGEGARTKVCQVLSLALDQGGCLAAAGTTSKGKASCFLYVHRVRIYLPARFNTGFLGTGIGRWALSEADLNPERGWAIAEMSLRQEVRSNRDGTRVETVSSLPGYFTTPSAATIGVTVIQLSKDNTSVGRDNVRSEAVYQLSVRSPFGAWNPTANYRISILGNVNGQADYSPATADASLGRYVDHQRLNC
jgi:hypothetical protein